MNPRAIALIARTVLLEAVRRKEIYVVVLLAMLMIGAVMTINFFDLEGLNKFYREVALSVMSLATALAVIVLSARQLPREFESRTIFPLLAKPVTRLSFLLGKLAGVMLAAGFCFAMFMVIYVIGTWLMGGIIPWGLFLQYVYLQMIMMLILATLGFWLSMLMNLDAAVTIGVLFYAAAATLMSMTSYLYDYMDRAGQVVLTALTFLIPQLTLFDLSAKTIHAEAWDPLSLSIMAQLTLYGVCFAACYLSFAAWCFRRRPL